MLIRNGIKTCFRQKGRTVLFFLLIMLLTVALLLAQGVMLYCDSALTQADRQYRSIAVVEYMGEDYPAEDAADQTARRAQDDFLASAPERTPGVRAVNTGNVEAAALEGFQRRGGKIPYLNDCVILCSQFSERIEYPGTKAYRTALIQKTLYGRKDWSRTMVDIILEAPDFNPVKKDSYVFSGHFEISLKPGSPTNGLRVFVVENVLKTDELPYEKVVDKVIPERFNSWAQFLHDSNNYVRVLTSSDVEDQYAFQQNLIRLEEGGFPGEGGCVITPDIAEQLGVGIGDTLPLRCVSFDGKDLYAVRETGETRTLQITGILAKSADYYGTVWTVGRNAETPFFGYLLATLSLENAHAEEAVVSLRAKAQDGIRITLYDQGYGETVKPFREVRASAQNIFLLSLAGVLVVLFLFAFLYIGRQQETIRTMVCLGTTRPKIALWMLSGAFVLVLLSAGIGAVAARLLTPRLIAKVVDVSGMHEAAHLSLRYSETNVGVIKEAAFAPEIPLWPAILAAAGVVLAAVLLCLIFLVLARRRTTKVRGRSRVRVPHGKTSKHGRGPWRFAHLSILRGGLRTLIVPLVTCVLTVLVIFLSGVYQNWVTELSRLTETTPIDGMVLSLDGRTYSGLTMPIQSVRTLLATDGVDRVTASRGFRYWLEEEMPEFSEGYGQENRDLWIFYQPDLVCLNELRGAKEFYYQEASVEWLDGWDEARFGGSELPSLFELFDVNTGFVLKDETERLLNTEYPAIVSDVFLAAHGLKPGDLLVVNSQIEYSPYSRFSGNTMRERSVLLRIVGSYHQLGSKANIYIPFSAYCPADIFLGEEGETGPGRIERTYHRYLRESAAFQTCRFTLNSAAHLPELRENLAAKGFSEVGRISKIRTTVLLSDAAYLKLKESMERNISIGRTVGILIAGLIVVAGFLVSWLMTSARKREFALMRGFGAGRVRIFLSFFHEQFVLCLAGCLAGALSLLFLYAGSPLQFYVAAAFFVLYLLGCVAAVVVNARMKLMELFTVRE